MSRGKSSPQGKKGAPFLNSIRELPTLLTPVLCCLWFLGWWRGGYSPPDFVGCNYCLGCNPSPISLIAQRNGERNAPAQSPQEAAPRFKHSIQSCFAGFHNSRGGARRKAYTERYCICKAFRRGDALRPSLATSERQLLCLCKCKAYAIRNVFLIGSVTTNG